MATQPIERPFTPLRQRMLDDMAMRTMRSRTQHDYVRHVRAFAVFLGRSPDTATAEDMRRFQLHQREHDVGESTINDAVSALRFLIGVTPERPSLSRRLVMAHRLRELPDMPSVDDVAKLLEAAPGIRYRAALGVRPELAGIAKACGGTCGGRFPGKGRCGHDTPGSSFAPWPGLTACLLRTHIAGLASSRLSFRE